LCIIVPSFVTWMLLGTSQNAAQALSTVFLELLVSRGTSHLSTQISLFGFTFKKYSHTALFVHCSFLLFPTLSNGFLTVIPLFPTLYFNGTVLISIFQLSSIIIFFLVKIS